MSKLQTQLDDLAAMLRNPPKSLLKKFGLYRRPKDYYNTQDANIWLKPEVIIVIEKANPDQYRAFMEAWAKWSGDFRKASKCNVTFLPAGTKGGNIRVFFDKVVANGGVTHTQCVKGTDVLEYAEIHVNQSITDRKRLRSVLLHEIGHALGLPHSPNDDDCMHPVVYVDYVSSTDKGTLERNHSEKLRRDLDRPLEILSKELGESQEEGKG